MNTCAQCLVMNTCEQCLLLSLHSFIHLVDASSLRGLAAAEVFGVAQIEQLLFCWAYEALRLPELCPSPLELRKRCGLARQQVPTLRQNCDVALREWSVLDRCSALKRVLTALTLLQQLRHARDVGDVGLANKVQRDTKDSLAVKVSFYSYIVEL